MCAEIVTTQWSQVLAARDGSDTKAHAALEGLCQTYWQPLYAYVRHQGENPDDARDLTQGFFLEFLEKDVISAVDPSKGRFRAFLLASLRNYLSHERARERRLKRGGGTSTISLDFETGEEHYAGQSAEQMTPEEVYEYRWAVTVLDRAMGRLAAESQGWGNEDQFQRLKPYLTGEGSQPSYRDIASDLGMSEGAVKVAVHRLRKRFGQALRLEIAQTVVEPADTDAEVRHLLEVLRG